LYPTLGPELLTDSAHRFGSGFLLELEDLRWDYYQYLAGFTDHADSRVSPLMSVDLTGSAPAIVVVAECDPLRDEAVAYAGLLEHFGTRVQILEAEGMVHGFLRLGGVVPDALSIVDDLAAHLCQLVGVTS
jgi:acetyl esterase